MPASHPGSPTTAAATLLPCYLDPLRDCSEKVESIKTDIVLLAAALLGVGVGVLFIWLVLFP